MTFADIVGRASKFAIDNSSTILTTVGVVGAVSTAWLAGKASWEAADIIRLKEADDYARGGGIPGEPDRGELYKEPREIFKERVLLVWKLYIPAATVCTATVICIVYANRIGTRRAAALAAGTTIIERSYEEYRAKVAEKFGQRKEEQVRDEIIQDRINNSWDDSIEVYGRTEGDVFYDKFSDRYVFSTQEGIRSAVNDLNQAVVAVGYATAADFYSLLDMPAPPWSMELGWNANDQLMRPRFSSHLSPGGKPVNAFEFDAEPTRNYQRFH